MSTLFVLGGTVLYSFVWLNRIPGYSQHKIASFIAVMILILIVHIIFYIYRIKSR